MPKTIIDETVYNNAKKALLKLKSYGTTANKLKAVISAYDNGIKKVSEVFNVCPTSIHRWAKQISDNSLDLLINDSKHQEGIKLKQLHKEEIRKWLSKDPNISILWVKEKLKKRFNLEVSKSTVHRAMRSVGFSYITPRQTHYKQDKKESESFKKKSPQ
jgi:transposase|tara:strand:+ start:101 stop:577 length:477 start_codon:yes stop_codon:yes gene_type:complete